MGKRQPLPLDVVRLQELFELRADGVLVRRGWWKGQQSPVAGSPRRKDGYWRVRVDGEYVLVHRIVHVLSTGVDDGLDVDHIDGDVSNNRPSNLRSASHCQNQRNRRNGNKRNTSGITGVVWDKSRKLWAVQVVCGGKNHHYGRWPELELAGLIAQVARERLFGAFAPVLS